MFQSKQGQKKKGVQAEKIFVELFPTGPAAGRRFLLIINCFLASPWCWLPYKYSHSELKMEANAKKKKRLFCVLVLEKDATHI